MRFLADGRIVIQQPGDNPASAIQRSPYLYFLEIEENRYRLISANYRGVNALAHLYRIHGIDVSEDENLAKLTEEDFIVLAMFLLDSNQFGVQA